VLVLWILLAVLAAGFACVAYGVFIERRSYRLVRQRLDILPARTSGDADSGVDPAASITILHLSDLHYVRPDARKTAFLAALPRADVTVITGDLLGEPEAVVTTVDALRPVRGRLASYFVLGSNDHYTPRPLNYLKYFAKHRTPRVTPAGRAHELVRRLESDGWVHLRNTRGDVDLSGERMELLGLDDPHIGWHDLRVAPRSSPDRFGLAVVHSPDPSPELAALGYDLILSGHTHGGQVRLPFIGALVTNCSLPPRLASGLIRFGGTLLYTSQGLGTSKYAPFRFLCPPEATMLELRRERRGQDSESTLSKTRS
jgi:predicted MPP superfamily phosphohydrolase